MSDFVLLLGAKSKVATKFYTDVKQKRSLPNMLLKWCLVKSIYIFQGPMKTDENYMSLLTICLTP